MTPPSSRNAMAFSLLPHTLSVRCPHTCRHPHPLAFCAGLFSCLPSLVQSSWKMATLARSTVIHNSFVVSPATATRQMQSCLSPCLTSPLPPQPLAARGPQMLLWKPQGMMELKLTTRSWKLAQDFTPLWFHFFIPLFNCGNIFRGNEHTGRQTSGTHAML